MRKKILAGLLSLAMVLTYIPVSTYADIVPTSAAKANQESTNNDSQEASTVVFKNNGYPYGKEMSGDTVKLVIETEETADSYQWQSADSKDGEYTDINWAKNSTYTIRPTSGTWYRCVVDGVPSKAVQLIKPGKDTDITWTRPHYDRDYFWYISNGTMAYWTYSYRFDVAGLYTKDGKNYMLSTNYSNNDEWSMYSTSKQYPNSGNGSLTNSDNPLEALRISFDDNDYEVIFEVDLKDGDRAFSFSGDAQIGNSSTSGDYADYAALNATLKNNKLQKIAMIGAANVNQASDDDPAFVITPITENSIFWIGHRSSRKTFSYNTMENAETGYKTQLINGQNVVTSVEGKDTGLTMSWYNLESGGSVKFKFSVGTVKATGAVSAKVDYPNEKITGLEASKSYVVTADGEQYTLTTDAKGGMALAGTDDNGKPYDFFGKAISFAKVDTPDALTNIDVSARPVSPSKPSNLEDASVNTPEAAQRAEIKGMTENSVTISPADGQQYAYSSDGNSWITLTGSDKDENGCYKVAGLSDKVYIKTRKNATDDAAASEWSEAAEVILKASIIADVKAYNGEYDGKVHTIEVNPTNVSDAVIKYSLTPYGEYTTDITMPELTDIGTTCVYYKIEKDGYYPLYGRADITITKRTLSIVWSDLTVQYDGTAKLPTATLKGLLDGDTADVEVSLYYYDNATEPGRYLVKANVSGFNADKYIVTDENITFFTIEKADRADKPVITATAETVSGKKDGKITGLTTDMEYRTVSSDESGEDEYFPVTDAMLADDYVFESGTYAIRYKETGYKKASEDTIVTVAEGKKYVIKLPAENEQIGYTITSDKSEIGYNEEAILTVTLKSGYERTDDFTITVNGAKVTNIGEGSSFTFPVKDAGEDIIISVTGVADVAAPTGEISLGKTSSWKTFLNNITFNLFFKERQHVTITAEDEGTGVKSVEYYIYTPTKDKSGLSLSEVEAISNWKEGMEFNIDPSAKYVIYAKLTDNAGNVAYISTDGIVLDDAAPAVTGITEGKSYCKDVNFTVSDNEEDIYSVTYKIDGGDITELYADSSGKYTIPVTDIVEADTAKNITLVVTDKAGNETVINIKAVHEYKAAEEVNPTVLYKGYTVYKCDECDYIYNNDYVSALGTAALVPNDKKQLTDTKTLAQAILDSTGEPSFKEEDKTYYDRLIKSVDSMLADIKKAEELKQTIDDAKITEIINPTIDDKDKLDETLINITELLDENNAETPTQSLTDEQKKELGSLKDIINEKLGVIAKVGEELKAVKEGTSTEAGVDTIDKMENVQPGDRETIASVLAKLDAFKIKYADNLSDEQKKTVDGYYTMVLGKLNAVEADIAADTTTDVIGDIKTSAIDEEGIKSQIKEALKKAGLENVDVEVTEFNKTPATLHEKGKIKGTVEIKSGETTKLVEIDNELPELSTYVNYESVVEEGAPKADVSVDVNALMDNVLGEEECSHLMNGSNANITLNIKNKDAVVTDEEVKAIADKLTDNEKIGKYLDINLYLSIVDDNGVAIITNAKISEANTTFTIKIDVPEELRPVDGVNRTYQIIRVHNGVAEVLDATYDETDHTLTFMTDRFSTYAIVYSDAESLTPADSQVSDGGSTATGDVNSVAGWLLLMAAATLGIIVVSKKRRYAK